MAGDKEDHEFMSLHMFKEEYIAKLKALGIESREDLGVSEAEEPEEEPAKVRKVKAKETEDEESDEDEGSEDEEDEEADEGEEEEEEVEIEDEEEEEGYRVKLKPELTKEVLDALEKRKLVASRRPTFVRQEYHRRQKLQKTGWRRPRGMHSKMRQHYRYRTNVVSIGYGGPKQARNLHPSGFREVIVHNVKDLETIDPKVQAARVAHTVGMRKRVLIEERADELSIRILNRSG
jgi:large subunit ribosomal protein L32e